MAAGAEVLRYGPIGGQEPLSVAGGLEPLQAPLALAGRLVRVLRAIIQTSVLPMFDPWKELTLGGSVALEFVGDDHARDVGQAFQQFAEELLRGPLIPPPLHQNIKHLAVLIDRPPEIVALSFDRQKHLVHMPLIAWLRTAAAQLVGILLAELAAPLADSFVRHDDSAFKQ
jgi:hypothetical protein